MSIQVQSRVQALYNVYAASEAFSAVQVQDRHQVKAPRIAAGDYHVAAHDIAARMIDQRI